MGPFVGGQCHRSAEGLARIRYLPAMSERRRQMTRDAGPTILELAASIRREADLDDVVIVVAEERDPAARLLLDRLGLPAPAGPPRPGEREVLVQAVLRGVLASVVSAIDPELGGLLREVRPGAIAVLAVADGGANTAFLRVAPKGSA